MRGRPRKYNTEEEIKQAVRNRDKNYYRLDPLKGRDNFLKQKYGITLDDYNTMFTQQNGCCSICGKHQSEISRTLAVDHCHTTGKIRGLLCMPCNLAIGKLNDDITLLKNAIKYLKQYGL